MRPTAPVAIAFDVTSLDASCRFYGDLLGFTVTRVDRAGLPLESRALDSPRFPGFGIVLRESLGRRVMGCGPGTLLRISLVVPDVAAAAKEIGERARWVAPVRSSGEPVLRAEFLDPDGYAIELRAGET